MKKKQKKTYVSPISKTMRLNGCAALLAGSNLVENASLPDYELEETILWGDE